MGNNVVSSILTVTLNPALDRWLEVENFRAGADQRSTREWSTPGGKGINVSRALTGLGVRSVLTGFAGGAVGQNFLRDLLLEGFEHHFVFIQGETRINLTIRDPRLLTAGVTRVIEAGPQVDKKDIKSFRERFRRLAGENVWTVLCGRGIRGAPDNFHQELIESARKAGSQVLVDTSGGELGFALKAKPDILKINRAEAEELLGVKLATPRALRKALAALLAKGASRAVITLGREGAAGTDGREFWLAKGHAVKARNEVGSGDAFTAGLLVGLLKEQSFSGALNFANAAAAAACLRVIPGELAAADVRRFVKKGRVKNF